MINAPGARDPLEIAWSTFHDGLTEYLDEEARIARDLELIKEERQRLSEAQKRLVRDRRENQQRGSELARFWWETWAEGLFDARPNHGYEVPLNADPWIGRVTIRFEPDPATGEMRHILDKAYGADGRPLELIRDPEIEKDDGELR